MRCTEQVIRETKYGDEYFADCYGTAVLFFDDGTRVIALCEECQKDHLPIRYGTPAHYAPLTLEQAVVAEVMRS